MAINISFQYNGGFLPDSIMLTLCCYQLLDRTAELILYYCIRGLTNAFYFSEKSIRFLGNFLDLKITKTLGFLTQFVRY